MKIDVVQKSFSTVIEQVEIELIQYEINSFAVANVTFYDTNGTVYKQEIVRIDGDDFNVNWNSDDDFINIVLSKLNIEKIPDSLPLKRSDLTDSSAM
jgi:hypothetical protein